MQNVSAVLYLVAAVLFVLALKGLSSPASARRGNLYGIVGMAIAVLTTLLIIDKPVLALIAGAIAAGAVVGAWKARTVEMTGMPELVAAMHSLVGLSAVLIAVAAIFHGGVEHTPVQKVELFIGAFIGAITFTASVVAYGKLSGRFGAKAISFAGQHPLNLLLALAMVGFGAAYFFTDSQAAFLAMVAVALALGVTLIIPIGGADMPVVVSMLNSYSGWAAAGIGFTLNNPVLIIAGACVGSSGAILSYIMCKAMNRSIVSVLLGGFGAETVAGPAGDAGPAKAYKAGSAEDAAFLMANADQVVIVPGYGLAVSRAQHALQEFAELLHEQGVGVRYAIHPVAGRMPGHMNVLLAEAEVPYEQVLEMEEINADFSTTDVVLVIGANDVVNPAAQKDKQSPIYGMPILEAHKARNVIVVKRSMNAGYAGLDNELFYMDKTMMVFGDAKKVVEDLLKNAVH
ncbi:NAD(P)(+) transhydrogenase (Re/Si-specific) subunit beta [Chromobacterium piscinae]|uniref:NAD(P)(+) transhydrogenase (Re/Si-specific) subunit beta n=1 Tax=Chromobacterium piscinae TaxID=686831 RepID=UPI001C8B7B5A|nr:NAD(P)(+) transhydrogenase (Re/Si-specific) subunit beta [Chromobacterium piscinae]MBX9299194.1 NAD(P)(+) transhydrogenase (Re/Si-specific) subunit beta [Chromobacterium vaccinii]MBX9345999.1 NAD(P)(+) transhydrogenase (Re/Si-specific) subunit beta [Chromobacterium vaccinii]MBX9358372.1 NAD(P)(+) transhydrogenase (Re/Si-specific) subunit beta [Chromobacterium vaccinii]MCD4502546.1 NAD(P)(+) transhydrogenase (Re/Si-specific) subunit beta [Chromobacterium piscinae]MCD5327765.1 NAD(P)(+) trans